MTEKDMERYVDRYVQEYVEGATTTLCNWIVYLLHRDRSNRKLVRQIAEHLQHDEEEFARTDAERVKALQKEAGNDWKYHHCSVFGSLMAHRELMRYIELRGRG